jgi:selenocysteine lyase/cysteine desulfurase
VPLDVAALGASFLAAPSHKWLMGSYGTGLLYLRSDWLEGELPLGGWLSVEPALLWQSFAGTQRTDDAQGFIAQGTRFRREASALEGGVGPWLGVYGLDAALDLHERLGRSTALAHNLALQQRLRTGLRSRGFSPNAPDDPAFGSGICVVPVHGGPEDAVRALIRERKVVTTPRGGGLRISTHVYNDENDVDALLAGIDALGIKPA